jgi:hypothetical protein
MKKILFIFSVFLFACEGSTNFTKEIYNNSSETLSATFYFSSLSIPSSFIINPNSASSIYIHNEQGSFAEENYSCVGEIDSVVFSFSNNRNLTKDIYLSENWMKISKHGRNATEACIFIFTDEDLN